LVHPEDSSQYMWPILAIQSSLMKCNSIDFFSPQITCSGGQLSVDFTDAICWLSEGRKYTSAACQKYWFFSQWQNTGWVL